jgi:hypothetical protein
VNKLKRLNIIVGANSSGKTAFLESLFMVAGPAAAASTFQLRALRQLGGQFQIVPDADSYYALWEDLFHWFDRNNPVSISAIGSAGASRSLTISYGPAEAPLLPFGTPQTNRSTQSAVFPQILFQWQHGDDPPVNVKPKVTQKGLEFEGSSSEYFPVILFGPHVTNAPDENARRFSTLSREGKDESIVKALKDEYSFLDGLGIEYASGIPSVFASVRGSTKKLAVGLLSDGVNKLLSILLGIATYPGGTILIDQIEDGFYYDRFESIWKTIYSFAVLHHAQIFATSHSRECLRALLPVAQEHTSDLCLLRTKRERTTCSISQFDGEGLLAALQKNGEIR